MPMEEKLAKPQRAYVMIVTLRSLIRMGESDMAINAIKAINIAATLIASRTPSAAPMAAASIRLAPCGGGSVVTVPSVAGRSVSGTSTLAISRLAVAEMTEAVTR